MPTSYTPNPFSGGAIAPQVAQAQALRNYAPNAFSGAGGPLPAAAKMAPHLSQDPTLDPDYLEVYRGLKTDPNVPANKQIDIDRIWRTSPTSPMFKPGYAHNDYVTGLVNALRQRRIDEAKRAQGMRQDKEGNWIQGTFDAEGGWHRVGGSAREGD